MYFIGNIGAITTSENVAAGFNTSATTLTAWNTCPSHKANLEGNHTHFGLVVKADPTGENIIFYYLLESKLII